MLVTKKAPSFIAPAVLPDGKIIDNFDLSKSNGKNGMIIFFWPKDFTFVCPSEIIAFDNSFQDFQKKGINIIGVSVDSDYVHLAWRNMEPSKGGIGKVQFPLVSDIKRDISKQYDVLFEDSIALRGSFLIDKNFIVRHAVINDLPLGRSIEEMMRMVEALQFFEENGEVCPANWKKGKDAIKATPEGIAKYLEKNSKDI